MLAVGDVIWVFDRTTNPPKSRMMVCLSFDDGWLVRINTSNRFRPAVPIDKVRNPWLDHDSHVECSIQEWDEYEILESLKRNGKPVGKLHRDHFTEILKAFELSPIVRSSDKEKLRSILF